MKTVDVGIAVAVVAAGLGVGPAAAHHASGRAQLTASAKSAKIRPSGVKAKMVISPNWAGYVATAPTKPSYGHPYFTRVAGTWIVPPATCRHPKASTSSTVWVGIGGYATRNQEEVGTNSNCSASGKPTYFAWFELVPYLSYRAFPDIKDEVAAGDTMTGLVQILSARLVKLEIANKTRGWTFSRKITFSSQDTSTVDWIVEAPATCVQYTCKEASLANFGSVTMRDISAVAKGLSGTLIDPRWKVLPVRLVPSKLIVPTISPTATAAGPGGKTGQAKSPAGATPGAVSRDGKSFSLKWIAVATRGL